MNNFWPGSRNGRSNVYKMDYCVLELGNVEATDQSPPPAAQLCERHFPDAWTSLNSARFPQRDAEQEFAVRLAVLSGLLIFARLTTSAYTT